MLKRILQITAGVVIGLLLMWLLLRGVSFAELRDALRHVSVKWLILVQVPIWLAFFTRVQRWTYIVRAVHPARYRSMFIATQLMFLWNFTLGMRLGEIIRPVVLSRMEKIPFSKGVALSTLDRVTDLIGLIATVGIALIAYRPTEVVTFPPGILGIAHPPSIPPTLIQVGSITATVGLLVLILLLVALYINQRLALRIARRITGLISPRLADFTCRMLEQFAEGLHVFRSTSDILKSIAFSLLTWALFILAITCFMEAFQIDYPWYAPFIVQALLAFFVGAPGTPGMLGQFHLPIVGGLLMVTDATIPEAIALALLTHLFNMVPITVFGIYSLRSVDMRFGELFRQSTEDAHEDT